MTYKEIIKLILENKPIDLTQLNTFITEYVKKLKNIDVTPLDLQGIIQVIQIGTFNLRYAALMAAISLNLNVTTVFGKDNRILRTIVTD